MDPVELGVEIQWQPDDVTCGPTCLHAVYRYFDDPVSLEEVVETTQSLPGEHLGRGTLAVMLGIDALRRGYTAHLITFNLQVFDPTWFDKATGEADERVIASRLAEQAAAKRDLGDKFALATAAYMEFLSLGGTIATQDLTLALLARYIARGLPVLTGLSSTYLYQCAREYGHNDDYDDIRGLPQGHFVVLHGFDRTQRLVSVADPMGDNPGFGATDYKVPMARLTCAILLGVLTYDGNLLVIEPAHGRTLKEHAT
jgi:hypothetical protein